MPHADLEPPTHPLAWGAQVSEKHLECSATPATHFILGEREK